MMPRLVRSLVCASLLVLPVPVAAQLEAPNRRDVVESVAERCPGLIANDHAFTDAVASELYRQDQRWGRNGKRGNANDLSHDAIAFRNPNVPFGVSIVDIIGGAGGPDPSPAWIDQTAETIRLQTRGVWVAPTGRTLPCLTGEREPPPSPPPVVTPPPDPPGNSVPPLDLTPVLEALQRIEVRLSALEQSATPDLGMVHEYVDDMIGNGPGDDAPNHITDIKQRQDAARADLAEVLRILRAARVLRY